MDVNQERIEEIKKYLSAYTKDSNRLDALIDRRIELCNKAVYRGPQIENTGKVKNGPPDRFAEILASIDEVDRQILNAATAMNKHYDQIDQMIASLGYEYDAMIVMQYRYINGWKWKDIAAQLHFNISYVYRLHEKALELLAANADVTTTQQPENERRNTQSEEYPFNILQPLRADPSARTMLSKEGTLPPERPRHQDGRTTF